jgi:HTH-type transcriptional regulator / antitoxin HigA
MNITPIPTEADYKATLAIVSKLVDKDPAPGTPDGDRLDVLTTLIQAYEAKHYPIPSPDPIRALR